MASGDSKLDQFLDKYAPELKDVSLWEMIDVPGEKVAFNNVFNVREPPVVAKLNTLPDEEKILSKLSLPSSPENSFENSYEIGISKKPSHIKFGEESNAFGKSRKIVTRYSQNYKDNLKEHKTSDAFAKSQKILTGYSQNYKDDLKEHKTGSRIEFGDESDAFGKSLNMDTRYSQGYRNDLNEHIKLGEESDAFGKSRYSQNYKNNLKEHITSDAFAKSQKIHTGYGHNYKDDLKEHKTGSRIKFGDESDAFGKSRKIDTRYSQGYKNDLNEPIKLGEESDAFGKSSKIVTPYSQNYIDNLKKHKSSDAFSKSQKIHTGYSQSYKDDLKEHKTGSRIEFGDESDAFGKSLKIDTRYSQGYKNDLNEPIKLGEESDAFGKSSKKDTRYSQNYKDDLKEHKNGSRIKFGDESDAFGKSQKMDTRYSQGYRNDLKEHIRFGDKSDAFGKSSKKDTRYSQNYKDNLEEHKTLNAFAKSQKIHTGYSQNYEDDLKEHKIGSRIDFGEESDAFGKSRKIDTRCSQGYRNDLNKHIKFGDESDAFGKSSKIVTPYSQNYKDNLKKHKRSDAFAKSQKIDTGYSQNYKDNLNEHKKGSRIEFGDESDAFGKSRKIDTRYSQGYRNDLKEMKFDDESDAFGKSRKIVTGSSQNYKDDLKEHKNGPRIKFGEESDAFGKSRKIVTRYSQNYKNDSKENKNPSISKRTNKNNIDAGGKRNKKIFEYFKESKKKKQIDEDRQDRLLANMKEKWPNFFEGIEEDDNYTSDSTDKPSRPFVLKKQTQKGPNCKNLSRFRSSSSSGTKISARFDTWLTYKRHKNDPKKLNLKRLSRKQSIDRRKSFDFDFPTKTRFSQRLKDKKNIVSDDSLSSFDDDRKKGRNVSSPFIYDPESYEKQMMSIRPFLDTSNDSSVLDVKNTIDSKIRKPREKRSSLLRYGVRPGRATEEGSKTRNRSKINASKYKRDSSEGFFDSSVSPRTKSSVVEPILPNGPGPLRTSENSFKTLSSDNSFEKDLPPESLEILSKLFNNVKKSTATKPPHEEKKDNENLEHFPFTLKETKISNPENPSELLKQNPGSSEGFFESSISPKYLTVSVLQPGTTPPANTLRDNFDYLSFENSFEKDLPPESQEILSKLFRNVKKSEPNRISSELNEEKSKLHSPCSESDKNYTKAFLTPPLVSQKRHCQVTAEQSKTPQETQIGSHFPREHKTISSGLKTQKNPKPLSGQVITNISDGIYSEEPKSSSENYVSQLEVEETQKVIDSNENIGKNLPLFDPQNKIIRPKETFLNPNIKSRFNLDKLLSKDFEDFLNDDTREYNRKHCANQENVLRVSQNNTVEHGQVSENIPEKNKSRISSPLQKVKKLMKYSDVNENLLSQSQIVLPSDQKSSEMSPIEPQQILLQSVSSIKLQNQSSSARFTQNENLEPNHQNNRYRDILSQTYIPHRLRTQQENFAQSDTQEMFAQTQLNDEAESENVLKDQELTQNVGSQRKTYNISENCILYKENMLLSLLEQKCEVLKGAQKIGDRAERKIEGDFKGYIKRYKKGDIKIYKLKKRLKMKGCENIDPPEEKTISKYLKKFETGHKYHDDELSDQDSFSSDEGESVLTPNSYITDDTKSDVLSTGSSKLTNPQKLIRLGLNSISKNKSIIFSNSEDGVPKPTDKNETLAKIKSILGQIIENYEQGKPLFLSVPKNCAENCIFEDGRYQIKPNPEHTIVPFGTVRNRPRFNLLLFILNKVRVLLENDTRLTKREIYYQLKSMISNQRKTDTVLMEISKMLNVGLWGLNVTAQKGLVFGNLKLVMTNGEIVNCNVPGTLIPPDISDVAEIQSSAYFILVVEKESIFHKLLEENLPNKLTRPFILITGKGFPDLNTQLFLKKLWMIMRIPVFILVDADPDGIAIMLNYRFGSIANAHVSEHLAIPKARWLGVFPSEITRMDLPCENLNRRENILLKKLLGSACVLENENIKREIEILIEKGLKSGIEGLIKSETFLSNFYLSTKFFTNKFI